MLSTTFCSIGYPAQNISNSNEKYKKYSTFYLVYMLCLSFACFQLYLTVQPFYASFCHNLLVLWFFATFFSFFCQVLAFYICSSLLKEETSHFTANFRKTEKTLPDFFISVKKKLLVKERVLHVRTIFRSSNSPSLNPQTFSIHTNFFYSTVVLSFFFDSTIKWLNINKNQFFLVLKREFFIVINVSIFVYFLEV